MTHPNPQHPDGYYGEKRVQREIKARRRRVRQLLMERCPQLSKKKARKIAKALALEMGPIVMM